MSYSRQNDCTTTLCRNNAQRSTPRVKQHGVSLLMALSLVALVTTIIAGVSVTTQYALRRSAILTHSAQAMAYADSGITLAERLLQLDIFSGQTDSALDEWAQTLPPYPVDGGQVQGRIHELSSRYNLAMLATHDPFETAVFKRLWQSLGGNAQTADAVIAAIRTQQFVSVIGVLAAARLNASISEKFIHENAAFFTFLPINAEKINLNWVSAEVFAAYFNISVARARQLLNPLKKSPLSDQQAVQQFALRHGLAQVKTDSFKQNASSVIELRFGIKSRYFQVVSEVTIGEARTVMVATIDRSADTTKRLNQRLSKLINE